MTVFVDSAIISEVERAAVWGFIAGATTNPTLLAKSSLPPRDTLKKMASLLPGSIFYQLTAPTAEQMHDEAQRAADILGEQLILKIPATQTGFRAAAVLSKRYTCAITTIFAPEQALIAHDVGARFAIYYHNRAKRWLPEGDLLGSALVQCLTPYQNEIEVMAASFRSQQDVEEAMQAGVKHMTIKFDLLQELLENEYTLQAMQDFNENGCGIGYD